MVWKKIIQLKKSALSTPVSTMNNFNLLTNQLRNLFPECSSQEDSFENTTDGATLEESTEDTTTDVSNRININLFSANFPELDSSDDEIINI